MEREYYESLLCHIEFNSADIGIVCPSLRESDDDLAVAIGCDRKLLLHCRFVPYCGIDIEVGQHLASVERDIELALAWRRPGQFRPVEFERVGRARCQAGERVGKRAIPAAGLPDSLRGRIAHPTGIDRGRGV